MKWLKLFREDTKDSLNEESLDNRIADIRNRIAAIRRSYGWDEEPYKNVTPAIEHVPDRAIHQTDNSRDDRRNTSLDELKTKLKPKS